jgi:hypothetical protein
VLAVAGGVLAFLLVLGFVVGTPEDEEDAVPVDTEDAVGPVVSTADFTLTLPAGWVGAELSASGEGFGAALFPAEPELAAAVDGVVANVPRSFRVVAFDEDAVRSQAVFVDNLNVFRDDTIPSGMPFDDMMRAQERGFGTLGFELVESDTVDLDGRRFGRLHARVDQAGGSADSLVYITEESGDIWILTYSFSGLDAGDRALADGSAASISFE